MNIIFGEDQARELTTKFTVLELDTFKFIEPNYQATAYCVLENIPIADLPQVDSLRNLHSTLMLNYYKKNWNFCEQAIEHLLGKWGNELDTFYIDLKNRVDKLKTQTLDDS